MKNLKLFYWVIGLMVISAIFSFAPVKHGVYVQLHPDNNKKIIVQIVPDKTYSNVVVYVNFYASNNKRVAQKAYSLSDDSEKYVRKDQCTNRIFKFSFDETVTRVKIDHVNEDEVLDKNNGVDTGSKIDLPIAESALGPIKE